MQLKLAFNHHLTWLKWLIYCTCFLGGQAYANLMITPTRVVMDEQNRNAEVTLLNTTETTKVYRILWREMLQTSVGGYVKIDAPTEDDATASGMIRHSPRKVTIGPGKYQRLKLRLRLPADLPEGEYRSHLVMKVTDTGVQASDIAYNGEGAKLRLIPKLSFTIPVIVRKGVNNSSTDIAGVNLNVQSSEGPKLIVDVSHTGDFSSYGKLFAYMKATSSSSVIKIGEAHNIALFRETSLRTITIPLQVEKVPAGAVVQVVYEGDDEYEGQQLGTAAFTYKP